MVIKRCICGKKAENKRKKKEGPLDLNFYFYSSRTISKKDTPSQTLRSDLRKLFFQSV
jgi:hypothetical protein